MTVQHTVQNLMKYTDRKDSHDEIVQDISNCYDFSFVSFFR